jgi:hypothetical protein
MIWRFHDSEGDRILHFGLTTSFLQSWSGQGAESKRDFNHSLIQDIQLHHATDCQHVSACSKLRSHQSTHQVQCSYCDKSLTSEARYRRNHRFHGDTFALNLRRYPRLDARTHMYIPIIQAKLHRRFLFSESPGGSESLLVQGVEHQTFRISHTNDRGRPGRRGIFFTRLQANQVRQNTSTFFRTFCWSRSSGRQIGFKLSDPKV